MNFERLIIVFVAFGFIAFLFPNIVTAIVGISGSEPLKPLFEWIPYIFIGSFVFTLGVWAINRD